MYAIYGNIYHQYTPNVSISIIHGVYGVDNLFTVWKELFMNEIEWDAEFDHSQPYLKHHKKNSSKHLQVLCTRRAALNIMKPPKKIHPLPSHLIWALRRVVRWHAGPQASQAWSQQHHDFAKVWTIAKWCENTPWQNHGKFHHGKTMVFHHVETMLKPCWICWNTMAKPWKFPAEFAIRATGQFQHVLWGLPHLSFGAALAQALWMGPMCQWNPRKLHFSGSSKIF